MAEADQAVTALREVGFVHAVVLAGGWAAFRREWTATLRPAPPPGRWVPTGQEALKSGLMSGDAALSYEERQNVEDATKQ